MAHCNSKPKKMRQGGAAYDPNKKYSSTQLAKISELRTKLDMGDASQDEIAAMAKKLGVKGFKYGGKVKKMAEGGTISNSDKKMLDKMMAEISEGTFISPSDKAKMNMMNMTGSANSISNADQAKIKKMLKDVKMPSGPAKMPKAVRNMRARNKSKGGAGEAGPAVTRYQNGGCVMAGRGGKFKGIS